MKTSNIRYPAFLAAITALWASSAQGQDRIPADSDPTHLAHAQENAQAPQDWQLRIGGGAIYGPAFLGSDDYQLQARPNIDIRYKDRFFLSAIDGVGFDLLKTASFRAGPVVKFQQKRRESGKALFMIAGDRSDALRGLGDVSATAEAGGYVQYQAGAFSAKAEVRKGLGGHDGVLAELGARYTTGLPGMSVAERPIVFSIGPRATIVDDTYNQAYFGISPTQSARSGLGQFNAGGGLLSYGIGGALMIPVSPNLSGSVIGGFDRLAGDAAKSPLVHERGSRDQAVVGLGLTYRFGV